MIAVLVSGGVGVKSGVAIKRRTPGGPRINTLKPTTSDRHLEILSVPEHDEKIDIFQIFCCC